MTLYQCEHCGKLIQVPDYVSTDRLAISHTARVCNELRNCYGGFRPLETAWLDNFNSFYLSVEEIDFEDEDI